jgi:hypothetical protein
VLNDVTIDNCTKIIVGNVVQFRGLSKFKFASKFISFGVHGILSRNQKLVLQHDWDKLAPYILGVHCVAHKTWQSILFKTTFGV